jgi:hypothetical protein
VCRGILKKKIKPGAESGSYRISSPRQDPVEPRCCSFCDTPQHIVDKLIGSPPRKTHAYICDKCVDASVQAMSSHFTPGGPPRNLWHWVARKIGIHNSHLRHAN